MAAINILTAIKVAKVNEPGRYADGGGLYLNVRENGNKEWIFRYQLDGKRRNMGLGRYDKTKNTLSKARSIAAECRDLVTKGVDPINHRKEEKERLRQQQEQYLKELESSHSRKEITFRVCAERYIKNKSGEWKNAKHRAQWTSSLETYVFPIIGDKPIDEIELGDIRSVLDPIWQTKTETASRIRQRIESIISSAIAMEERQKSNPATWKGLLDNFYPRPDKLKRKKYIEAGSSGHHAAMPYEDLPEFMAKLKTLPGIAPMALRFMILTACRTSELRFATWSEISIRKKQWNIPGSRMKAGIDHRVALPDAAVKILESVPRKNDYLFPGWKENSPMSDAAFRKVLRDNGIPREVATPHGFRSSFRDYIGEETGFPYRLAEFALAHQLTDEAEKAYARGDMLKKRFAMMNAWARYLESFSDRDNVVHIDSGAKRA